MTQNKIPKILHLIWIGDMKPFIENTINAYKLANPDFDIRLHKFTSVFDNDTELNYCTDVLMDSINRKQIEYNSTEDYRRLRHLYEYQIWSLYHLYKEDMNFTINDFKTKHYSLLTDGYRYLLLQKYGGIYVDLDTFPIKPFDECLLNTVKFRSKNDCYFLGCCPGGKIQFTTDDNFNNIKDIAEFSQEIPDSSKYDDFYSGNMKYEENLTSNNYFYHFQMRSWK